MLPVARFVSPSLRLLSICTALALFACSGSTPQELISSARKSLAKEDNAAAVVQLKLALQTDPASREARLLLGEALLGADDVDGAIVELTKVLNDGGPEDEVLPSLSRALVAAGDYKKLVTLYGGKVLKSRTARAALKTNLAAAWGGLGQRAKSEAAIIEALAEAPDYGPAMVVKARHLAGAGRIDDASTLVEAAIAGNDRLHEAWLLKGEILEVTKSDTKSTQAAFNKALALRPSNVAAHAANFNFLLRQRDIDGAKAAAARLRAARPGHPHTALVDAQLAFVDQQYPRAREIVQLLLRAFPDHLQALALGGAVEAKLGYLIQAATHLKKALLLDPTLDVARRNLAEVEMRLGQSAKALDTLQPLLSTATPSAEALALAGHAQMRLGNAATAERHFLRAAELAPNDTRLLTAAAAARLDGNDIATALSALEQLSVKSKDTFADEALFATRMKRREFKAALATLDTMIQKQPGNAAHIEMRGRVHLARRDTAAARVAFEQALKVDPAHFAALSSLASLDAFEGKPDQAIARLKASVDADPKNAATLMALADMKVRTNGPVDEIKKLYADAIVVSPMSPEPRLALIDLALRQRRFKDALQLAQDALAATPWDLRVLDAAGQAQMRAGDGEQAAATFRRLASAAPTAPQPYLRLAEVYSASGLRDKAETALLLALEIDPKLVEAQVALLDVLVVSTGQSKSVERIRRLTQVNPNRPLGYLLEAEYQLRRRDVDAAAAVLRRGIDKTDSGELAGKFYGVLLQAKRNAEAEKFASAWIRKHSNDADFEYLMALAAIARADFKSAEQHLKRVLTTFPKHLLALNNLSWVMVNNESKGAVEIARRALDLQPDDPAALNNLAWVMLSVGDAGAVDFAQRAVELQPKNPNLLDTLAQALAAENRATEAVALQKRAVEMAPKDDNLRLTLAKVALRAGDKDLARKELQLLEKVGAAFPGQGEVKKLIAALSQ